MCTCINIHVHMDTHSERAREREDELYTSGMLEIFVNMVRVIGKRTSTEKCLHRTSL